MKVLYSKFVIFLFVLVCLTQFLQHEGKSSDSSDDFWKSDFYFEHNGQSYRVHRIESEPEQREIEAVCQEGAGELNFVGETDFFESLSFDSNALPTLFSTYALFLEETPVGYLTACTPYGVEEFAPGVLDESQEAEFKADAEEHKDLAGYSETVIKLAKSAQGKGLGTAFKKQIFKRVEAYIGTYPEVRYCSSLEEAALVSMTVIFKGFYAGVAITNIASLKMNIKLGMSPFRVNEGTIGLANGNDFSYFDAVSIQSLLDLSGFKANSNSFADNYSLEKALQILDVLLERVEDLQTQYWTIAEKSSLIRQADPEKAYQIMKAFLEEVSGHPIDRQSQKYLYYTMYSVQ